MDGTGTKIWFFLTIQAQKSLAVFVINETVIQISSQNSGYGFVQNHYNSVLGIYISEERNILVTEKNMIIQKYFDEYRNYFHIIH